MQASQCAMSTKVDIRSTSTAAPYSEYLSIFLATRTRRSSRAVFSNPISVVVYKESSLVCGFLFCNRTHQTHSRNCLKFLLNYSSSFILLNATSPLFHTQKMKLKFCRRDWWSRKNLQAIQFKCKWPRRQDFNGKYFQLCGSTRTCTGNTASIITNALPPPLLRRYADSQVDSGWMNWVPLILWLQINLWPFVFHAAVSRIPRHRTSCRSIDILHPCIWSFVAVIAPLVTFQSNRSNQLICTYGYLSTAFLIPTTHTQDLSIHLSNPQPSSIASK